MLKIFRFFLLAGFGLATAFAASAQGTNVLILYDSASSFGWYGNLHAKMLANLLGHFELPWRIKPVENYSAGEIDHSRATFYLGTEYRALGDGPLLPAAFTNDVLTATNTICWFKYNLWQVSWPNPAFNTKFGFGFAGLDASGFSNIAYKGETFLKDQADPELGIVEILNPHLATAPITAWQTNGGGAVSVPYVTRASNFWYVADSPFDFLTEENRYVAFADLLHDILGIDHPESHQAIIRIEDVGIHIYSTNTLRTAVDCLRSNNVPFALAVVPVYTDPLGTYNAGIPEQHHIADASDTNATAFLTALNHARSNGGQILIEGYTHQYDATANPFTGVSGEDFEFWRETFGLNTNTVAVYQPVPEDSAAWANGRVSAATNELQQAGQDWVGWFPPHYAASVVDYQVFATNFPLTMQRVQYFSDDYAPTNGHLAGQFFPYVIHRDLYGQKIIPENIGYYGTSQLADSSSRSIDDMLRAARKNLVVRDGWAGAFYHGAFGASNLQAIVQGVKSLGYTYVPIAPAGAPVITFQPRAQAILAQSAPVKFSVAVIGTEPFHYQWKFNGTNIPGATNALLVFASPQLTNAGAYTVIVTNSLGATNSASAALFVLTAPPLLAIQSGPASNACRLSFDTVSGPTYHVEYRGLFGDASWQVLTNIIGNGGGLNVNVPNGDAAGRFYRVRVQ